MYVSEKLHASKCTREDSFIGKMYGSPFRKFQGPTTKLTALKCSVACAQCMHPREAIKLTMMPDQFTLAIHGRRRS